MVTSDSLEVSKLFILFGSTVYFFLLGRGTAPSDLGQEGRTLEGRRRSLGTEIRLEGGLNNNNNNSNNKLEGELRTEQDWIIQCKGEDRRREIIETATEVSSSILSEGPKKAADPKRDQRPARWAGPARQNQGRLKNREPGEFCPRGHFYSLRFDL